jgi:hypothetical protein
MNPLLLSGLFEVGGKLIDRLLPDDDAKAQARIELLRMQQQGELAVMDAALRQAIAQTEVNKVEAASTDKFVSRWRPAVGWVCVAGLAYQFLAQPLLPWALHVVGVNAPELPAIDGNTLMVLLTGLLGLGGLRTVEKIKGAA